MFAVNSDNETDFRYLIDDNFDDEGNLHLPGITILWLYLMLPR